MPKQPTVIELTFAGREEASAVFNEIEKLLTKRGVGNIIGRDSRAVRRSPARIEESRGRKIKASRSISN